MMRKYVIILACVACCTVKMLAQNVPAKWGDWNVWGQTSESNYRNPVLPADFSDIDCIEHDGCYYAISSTFQFEPGMVILRSYDMVNWQIYSHAVDDITQIGPAMGYDAMNRYGKGIWAGAIRYHKGLYYVYFGCPDEGMFMTTAKDVKGPWTPLHKMNIDGGWDDCCPLFDDDGQNYFVATHYADGYKTYVFRLSQDGKTVDWDSKVLINEGSGREANKLYKFNGKYYHLFSEHKGSGRYLMMQHADNPMGPYTERHQLSYAQSQWHEPNQGGYLQDANGDWYFLTHHGKGDWGGREMSLLPVTWTKDGWPVIGQPDNTDVGNMVWNCKMPVAATHKRIEKFNAVRSFASADWEWNYHPRSGYYRKTGKKLILKAFKPLKSNDLKKAGNTLTIRSYQTPYNEAVVRMDVSDMADGQRSGMCHFSKGWSEFGVMMTNGKRTLYTRADGDKAERAISDNLGDVIFLRSSWGLDGISRYSYSLNGKDWISCDATYQLQWGHYRGDRLGLYTYNNEGEHGTATFSRFSYVTQ